MKPIVMVGVICIVLGLAALAYQGITYTTREKVVDVGPVQVTAEKEHAIWLPPLLGVVAVGRQSRDRSPGSCLSLGSCCW
jgi:hypothetical protein